MEMSGGMRDCLPAANDVAMPDLLSLAASLATRLTLITAARAYVRRTLYADLQSVLVDEDGTEPSTASELDSVSLTSLASPVRRSAGGTSSQVRDWTYRGARIKEIKI